MSASAPKDERNHEEFRNSKEPQFRIRGLHENDETS